MLTDDTKKKLIDSDIREQEPEVHEEHITDIQITLPTKQKFRINGDPNKIIELNPSDTNVIKRLEKGWTNLQKEVDKIDKLDVSDDKFTEKLDIIDKAMRKHVDYIFDYPVSEVIVGKSSMISPKDGQTTYEHILDALLKLYEGNINSEYKRMKARTDKHTAKYTKR